MTDTEAVTACTVAPDVGESAQSPAAPPAKRRFHFRLSMKKKRSNKTEDVAADASKLTCGSLFGLAACK